MYNFVCIPFCSCRPDRLCKIWGDPHAETFDGAKHDFYGYGQFMMSKAERRGNIPSFQFSLNTNTNALAAVAAAKDLNLC